MYDKCPAHYGAVIGNEIFSVLPAGMYLYPIRGGAEQTGKILVTK